MKEERRQFEMFIAARYPGWTFERATDGGYLASWLDGAWVGWSLRAERATSKPENEIGVDRAQGVDLEAARF